MLHKFSLYGGSVLVLIRGLCLFFFRVSQGGKFSLYGGSVQGVFREVAPNQRILMDWRFRWACGRNKLACLARGRYATLMLAWQPMAAPPCRQHTSSLHRFHRPWQQLGGRCVPPGGAALHDWLTS